jgi:hypothetical protein
MRGSGEEVRKHEPQRIISDAQIFNRKAFLDGVVKSSSIKRTLEIIHKKYDDLSKFEKDYTESNSENDPDFNEKFPEGGETVLEKLEDFSKYLNQKASNIMKDLFPNSP